VAPFLGSAGGLVTYLEVAAKPPAAFQLGEFAAASVEQHTAGHRRSHEHQGQHGLGLLTYRAPSMAAVEASHQPHRRARAPVQPSASTCARMLTHRCGSARRNTSRATTGVPADVSSSAGRCRYRCRAGASCSGAVQLPAQQPQADHAQHESARSAAASGASPLWSGTPGSTRSALTQSPSAVS